VTTHEIRIDYTRPLTAEPDKGHNRWHPDIPPVVRCRPGDEVVMETRDAFDLQITRDSTPDDVAKANLNVVHPLTGPVYVEAPSRGTSWCARSSR
jgi:formamidase